jgi:hypothetical protein
VDSSAVGEGGEKQAANQNLERENDSQGGRWGLMIAMRIFKKLLSGHFLKPVDLGFRRFRTASISVLNAHH